MGLAPSLRGLFLATLALGAYATHTHKAPSVPMAPPAARQVSNAATSASTQAPTATLAAKPPATPVVRKSATLQFGEVTTVQDQWVDVVTEAVPDPIVIAQSSTSHSNARCIPQIKDAQVGSFKIRCKENQDLKAWRPETVSWLVVQRGVHRTQGGRRIEAGTVQLDDTNELKLANSKHRVWYNDKAWKFVRYSESFQNRPAVFTQLQSMTNTDSFLHTRHRMVGQFSFAVALENKESMDSGLYNASEAVGWVALDYGDSHEAIPNGTDFTNLLIRVVPLAMSHQVIQVDYHTAKFQRPPLVYAEMQTTNAVDPAWVRRTDPDEHTMRMYLETDQSAHNNHGPRPREEVALMLVSDLVAFNTTVTVPRNECAPVTLNAPENGTVTCGERRGGLVCMFSCNSGYYLSGEVSSECTLLDGKWTNTIPTCLSEQSQPIATVQFGETSNVSADWVKVTTALVMKPLVFAAPATNHAPDLCIVEVKDIIPGSFKIRCKEPSELDPSRAAGETISWVVVSEGYHKASGGLVMESGVVMLNGSQTLSNAVNDDKLWGNVKFSHSFASLPVVFSQVQTFDYSLETSLHTRNKGISPDGFKVVLENEKLYRTALGQGETERVGWLAIEMGDFKVAGTLGSEATVSVRYGPDVNTGFTQLYYFELGLQKEPLVLASLQSTFGTDTAWLRRGDATTTTVQLKLEQDPGDASTTVVPVSRTKESVGVILVTSPVILNTKATKCKLHPPSSDSNNLTVTCNPPDLALGSVCMYTCASNGRLDGEANRICGEQGKWETEEPVCLVACGKAPPLPNGATQCSGTNHGDVCSAQCNPGYQLFGKEQFNCEGNHWTGSPECRALDRVTMQVGVVKDVIHQWAVVKTEPISDPVVVATLTTSNDPNACIPMIKDVKVGSFMIRCKEPSNADQRRDAGEYIAWMVVEKGIHTTPGGHVIAAGTEPSRFVSRKDYRIWQGPVSYGATINSPVVLAQLQTLDPNYDELLQVRMQSVGYESFSFVVEQDDATREQPTEHPQESVGWVAMSAGVTIETALGDTLRVLTTGAAITDQKKDVPFSNTYPKSPLVIGQLQTANGQDSAWLRLMNVSLTSATIYVQEDGSGTDKHVDKHSDEIAGLVVVSGPFSLRTKMTGCRSSVVTYESWETTCSRHLNEDGLYIFGTNCTVKCPDGTANIHLCDKMAGGWTGGYVCGVDPSTRLPAPKENTDTDNSGSGLTALEWAIVGASVTIAVLAAGGMVVVMYTKRQWLREKFGNGRTWYRLRDNTGDMELQRASHHRNMHKIPVDVPVEDDDDDTGLTLPGDDDIDSEDDGPLSY